jgi:isochorismate synthase
MLWRRGVEAGRSVPSTNVLIARAAIDELGRRLSALGPGLRVAWVDVDVDPVDLVRAGSAAFASSGVYQSPEGRALAGLGAAWLATASGHDRFRRLAGRIRELPEGAEVLVGYAFSADGPTAEEWSGFPGAVAVLPQIAVRRAEGRSRLIAAVPAGGSAGTLLSVLGTLRHPGEPAEHRGSEHRIRPLPDPEEWQDRVAEAVDVIRAGALDKVVLARVVDVDTGTPIDAYDLVARLRRRYPASRVFGWSTGSRSFVGASPELLIQRTGRRFATTPLAGSTRRGRDPDEDRELGDRLLSSEKDRVEHGLVVGHIVERLRAAAEGIDVPPAPVVRRFATVQHLATAITGSTDAELLGLAEVLHPTPAVAGLPAAEALAYIDKVESFDRGWYAGGIGWTDPSGSGELAVALRCALLDGDRARLFAGNGIVAGSSAMAELTETRLKLRAMLDLITGV